MSIWSSEIKELEKLFSTFKGQLPELEKELEPLINTQDPIVVMLYSRRSLEVIITDLCERELKRPRKTEPLKGIIDKLNSESKVPEYIITSMLNLNSLSAYGAHPKDFELEQVKPVINNLSTIIRWYLKFKNYQINNFTNIGEGKFERIQPLVTKYTKSAIINEFTLDIFISYRQKDNKYDGWVTEFVNNLKLELEATFKEEVSVYFDINPHDGLLETYDIAASLKEKLNCIVFIPIISHTYCDSKSFGWQNEFCVFNQLSKKDKYGRDIVINGGNVISRILPVKIHELDREDKLLLENELGGVLRGIEFIYKSPGVNRPLRSNEDHPLDNMNKTYYRDQINKVANAIKEIIASIKKQNLTDKENAKEVIDPKPVKVKRYYPLIIGITLFILTGLIFFNNIVFSKNKKKIVREESVIILESLNETNDSSKIIDSKIIEYLLEFKIQNECNLTLLNNIQFKRIYSSDSNEINLPQKSIICKLINRDYGYEIDYDIIDNDKNNPKLNGKLIFRDQSDLLNGELDKITSVLSGKIQKKNILTKDWDAFINFYNGEINWNVLNKNEAKRYYKNAIQIDSAFLLPNLRLAKIYNFEGNYKSSFDLIKTVVNSIKNLSIADSLRTIALWNTLTGDRRNAINNYKALIKYIPAQKEPFYELAEAYFYLVDINNAAYYYRKALEIDPEFTQALNHYAYTLSHCGQHDSALKYFKKYVTIEPTANAYDSYGDGFIACGELDSAKWAKLKGLEIDSTLDFLYMTLSYVNIREGKLKEAENNMSKYLKCQSEPELISRGLTNKAFIYFTNHKLKNSLDTCLKAKSIFDSKNLNIRYHLLHWILSRIYLENNNKDALKAEMDEMYQIISAYKVNEFNYNMIYKFYYDIKIRQFIKQGKIEEAMKIISIFDNEIYNKIKDWNNPFDVAFFNTEFGKLFLKKNLIELAEERFQKALIYNPKYSLAHYYLSICYKKNREPEKAKIHLAEFNKMVPSADKDYINLILSEKF